MRSLLFPIERVAWGGITLALLLLAFHAAHCATEASHREAAAQRAAADLQQQVRTLQDELAPTRAVAEPEDAVFPRRPRPTPAERDLIEDLQRHPELIPYSGVLGGKMGFHDPGGITVLGPQWVVATFEDGHIAGWALLRYRRNKSGRITWELRNARPD